MGAFHQPRVDPGILVRQAAGVISLLKKVPTPSQTSRRNREIDAIVQVMRKIGTGLQYDVYDLNNGRVLKVPKAKLQQVLTLLSWGYRDPVRIVRKLVSMNRMMETSLTKVKDLLRDSSVELAGSPRFVQGRAYEQDKAVPLKEFLVGGDVGTAKKIIDQYIQHIFNCWTLGFCEMTTNLTINHGLNGKGEVILLDLGELLVEKEEVAARLRNRLWRTSWAYQHHIQDPAIRNYFDEQMEQFMTTLNLDIYWSRELPAPALPQTASDKQKHD